MKKESADVVICGAGIAGVSAAYFLAHRGIRNIILVDELPPLTLTSSRSTECYRNWWPDPAMTGLMNRSIDLLENLADESGNSFSLNRRGYLFVTADESKISSMRKRAQEISAHGAGLLRIHDENRSTYTPHDSEGYPRDLTGTDLLIGSPLVEKYFPYLNRKSVAALHVRRAGWLSAQQFGMFMLAKARNLGVQFISASISDVRITNNKITSVTTTSGDIINTREFINAAGPYLKRIGKMCKMNLPVSTELHLKVAYKDSLAIVDRNSPLLIWDDPQMLEWEKEEREALAFDPDTRWLTESLPAGVHARPEGGAGSEMVLMLWDYHANEMEPVSDPPLDSLYPEVALRGMATMVPSLKRYFTRMPRPQLDGGFYTKSPDNRPIVGQSPVRGVYLLGALAGYGIMASCGVGDLIAAQISGTSLPDYASEFSLERFSSPDHIRWMESQTDDGQL